MISCERGPTTIDDFQVDTYYSFDTQTLLMMMRENYGPLKIYFIQS